MVVDMAHEVFVLRANGSCSHGLNFNHSAGVHDVLRV
jgi:hypothetical protein